MSRTEQARRRARETVFRIAYQADIAHESYASAWASRREEETLTGDQAELVVDTGALLDARGGEVDEQLQLAARNWTLDRLSATDRSVLRAAVSELMARPGTPARVVLDEAIEIAKRFGTAESGRFVNGVLDKVARTLRPGEFE